MRLIMKEKQKSTSFRLLIHFSTDFAETPLDVKWALRKGRGGKGVVALSCLLDKHTVVG